MYVYMCICVCMCGVCVTIVHAQHHAPFYAPVLQKLQQDSVYPRRIPSAGPGDGQQDGKIVCISCACVTHRSAYLCCPVFRRVSKVTIR